MGDIYRHLAMSESVRRACLDRRATSRKGSYKIVLITQVQQPWYCLCACRQPRREPTPRLLLSANIGHCRDILVDFHVDLDIFVGNWVFSRSVLIFLTSSSALFYKTIEAKHAAHRPPGTYLAETMSSEEDWYWLANISVASVVLSSPLCRFEESVCTNAF